MNEFKNVDELISYLQIKYSFYPNLEVMYYDIFDNTYKSITGVYKCRYDDNADDMFDYIGIAYNKDKKPLTVQEFINELILFRGNKSFVGLFDYDENLEDNYPKGIYTFKISEIETLGEKDIFVEINKSLD